jgi:AraC-like DNA-binding protein
LYVLRVPAVRRHEFVDAWKPPVPGVREVFHARFVEHAYPPHTHQAWTVLVVDDGAVRYALDRHDHGTERSTVTVLPPHVAHDGRAASSAGFAKRVVYLDDDLLGEHLIGAAVDRPTVRDVSLVRRIGALHHVLRRPEDALEAETQVALVAEALVTHLAAGHGDPDRAPDDTVGAGGGGGRHRAGELAASVRDLLDADLAASPTLSTLGAEVGASPTHLVRCFTATYGVPPHAYLVGRRVDAARRLLLEGGRPAEVATTVGFHDQAHLARHFRRHLNTTPGHYRSR